MEPIFLGRGSFSKVYAVNIKGHSRPVAAKVIKHGKMSAVDIKREIAIHSQLIHPNIVGYIGHASTSTSDIIYTDYCSNGTLALYIHSHKTGLRHINSNMINSIFAQLVSGLHAMHELFAKNIGGPVIHRDIKPANIFIDTDFNVKIADFGSAMVDSKANCPVTQNTHAYLAPEVHTGFYSIKADIWSLGVILFEMCHLYLPFNDAGCRRNFRRTDTTLQPFVSYCLQRDPKKRPSTKDIVKSDVFKNLARVGDIHRAAKAIRINAPYIDIDVDKPACVIRQKLEVLGKENLALQDKNCLKGKIREKFLDYLAITDVRAFANFFPVLHDSEHYPSPAEPKPRRKIDKQQHSNMIAHYYPPPPIVVDIVQDEAMEIDDKPSYSHSDTSKRRNIEESTTVKKFKAEGVRSCPTFK